MILTLGVPNLVQSALQGCKGQPSDALNTQFEPSLGMHHFPFTVAVGITIAVKRITGRYYPATYVVLNHNSFISTKPAAVNDLAS